MVKFRIEKDSLGEIKVESTKLWGAQTQRSLENFKIGNEKIPTELIVVLGQQKKAAAEANIELGVLNRKLGSLIVSACNDIIKSQTLPIIFVCFLGNSFNSAFAKAHDFFCKARASIKIF